MAEPAQVLVTDTDAVEVKDRLRALVSWWLPVVLVAVGGAGYLLLRSDDELHTVYTDIAYARDFPTDLTPTIAMRIVSADPLVVDHLFLGVYGVDDSLLVHTSLRSVVESLEFDDYVLASWAVVELPCDCGPDESPPVQPVVFSIQVASREEAEAYVAEEANTSGVALRLWVDEGILVVFRDGEAVFGPTGLDEFRGALGVAAVNSILDGLDRGVVEEYSRPLRARGGLQLTDRGYSYIPFGEYVGREIPAELEPLVADLMAIAEGLVAAGDKVE